MNRIPQSEVAHAIGVTEELYSFEQSAGVRRYLQNHTECLKALIDAYPVVDQFFGYDELLVSLSRSTEPGGNTVTGLYVRIVTDSEVERALGQLDTFDEEWWLDQPFVVRHHVCFDVDFR